MEEFTNRYPNLHLKHERELRGWTQQSVAERLDVSLSSIRDWEEGFASPNSYYCEKLCILYGKDAQALGLAEEMNGTDEPYIPILESAPLPIIQGEKLRLNNRKRRSNTFNTVVILLILTVVLLPSLWFLGKNMQPSTRISGPPTPDTQPTTQLSPTHFIHTTFPSQKTKSPFPRRTPTGEGTPPTTEPSTVTPSPGGPSSPTTVPVTATSTLSGGGYPSPTTVPVTATSTLPSGGNLSPTTGPGGPTATSTTIPPTATATPTPTPTPCPTSTVTPGVTITVTDDMQSPNTTCYDAVTQTHRADYARGSQNQVLFITSMNINGDTTLAERSSATAYPPYIVWRCSNITAFTAITYFYNYSSGEPDFTFQYSTSPLSAPPQWTAIAGIDAPATNTPTPPPSWTSRTYTLTNLPSGVNDIEIGWSTNATTTTNTTPLIGQVMMTCTGGY